MATHLITPNEAADGSHGEGTSVLRLGGRTSPLIIANPLIPRLFDEVSEGVRALPRGGAEIGGLLVGPKGYEGGVLATDIIPIPIEYRFGPSFRLSSPDLTKIEEAIATTHKDPTQTVVGFYRSHTRGGTEFRDSDQEILLAVELSHAAFATDFHFYGVLSAPARSEMALSLAVRNGNDWGEFRPFTCHLNPQSITSDLGDPEPMEMPIEPEAPQAEPEWIDAIAHEVVDAPAEAMDVNDQAQPVTEPEALNGDSHEQTMTEPEAPSEENHQPASAEPETMNAHSQETMTVEIEAVPSEIHEAAKADMEPLNGNGHTAERETTETPAPKTAGRKKASAKPDTAAKSETAATAKPRTKKTSTTAAKPKARSSAAAGSAARGSNAEPKVKSLATPAPLAVVAEPKLIIKKEPHVAADQIAKMRTQMGQFQWNRLTPRTSRRHILWAAGIIVVAALATGGYLLFIAPQQHPVAPPTHAAAVAPVTKQALALTAERHGTDLLLSWNRESPSISRASYGMLIIRGKDGRRDIALTPDQLHAGSIVYTPTTDQVQVELSVVAGEQVTKDSVIVFLPHKGDKNAIVTTAQMQDVPQSPVTPQVSSAQLNERERPKGPLSPPGRELKPFSMPTTPAGPETAGLARLDEPPPSLTQRPPQSAGVVSLPSPQLPSAPPPAAPPEVAAAQSKTPSKPAPPSVILPAVATEQVLPHFPESMKSLLSSPRMIEITVSIDETGKVVKADTTAKNQSDGLLVASAIEAARHWKFRPATINNKPIPSEMVVKFNFAPVKK